MTLIPTEVSLTALGSVYVWGLCMRNSSGMPEVASKGEQGWR